MDAFLERTGVGPTTLGRQAVGDPNLVRELRLGRSPRLALADRILAFIEAYDRAPSGDHGSTRAVRLRDSTSRAMRDRAMTRAMEQGMDAPARVLRMPRVEARTGLSRSTIYVQVAEGSFPKPVRLGGRAVGWIEPPCRSCIDAGRQALLRVFGTADGYLTPTGKGLATFFVRGQEVYRAPLEPPTPNIPLDVDESRLDRSFNARIPEHVLQPGLEMVAELDPDRTLLLKPGSRSRFPASGRLTVDVREVPPMHLTFVPVLYHTETEGATATNSQVENAARDLATEDSRGELRYTRDILPIGDLSVKLREPHYTSANTSGEGSGQILRELSMLRHLEAAEGEYYHGLFAVPEQQHPNWPGGEADPSGHVAISEVFGDFVQRRIIAHELGHNLSLSHAPCRTTGDPAFPYADGSIGIWGHRFIRGDATGFGELFPPEYRDIMSYCFPQWISDYHFSKALRFRSASAVATSRQTAVASTATLLLWGGTHDGDLRLEPAFVLDARVKIPEASGPYDVTGLDDEGRRLFSASFTPAELDHGGSSFLFAIPFEAEWTEDLDRVTLTGPEGSTTLDRDTGGRAVLIVDRASGRIRTIARDWYDGALPAAVPPNAQVEIIRGLPSR